MHGGPDEGDDLCRLSIDDLRSDGVTLGCLEDGRRDSELCALGFRVIRFWNNDIIDNIDGVLETLRSELEKWPLIPPSPRQPG